MNNILQCVENKSCCGCSACKSTCPTSAISMGEDGYGFVVPVVDREKCIDCGKCLKICPAEVQSLNKPASAYAAVNLDNEALIKSSSGGIFTELAKQVLGKGGAVFGCNMDESLRVRHIMVESIEELGLVTKSKYVQSSMEDIYPKIRRQLSQGRNVLFAGTPCQVSAVKNYVGKDGEGLITVDIVCHGVPSQSFFDSYVEHLQTKNKDKIDAYAFRYKKNSSDGMNWYSAYKFAGKKKTTVKNWPEDSFNWLYMSSAINRESCYTCRYAKEDRAGDITLCDYWGWDSYHRADFSDSQSVSAVLVNTDAGAVIFDKVLQSNCLKAVKSKTDWVKAHNGCLREAEKRPNFRDTVLERWKKDGYEKVDSDFKASHKRTIIKYAVMRHLPKGLIVKIRRMLKK